MRPTSKFFLASYSCQNVKVQASVERCNFSCNLTRKAIARQVPGTSEPGGGIEGMCPPKFYKVPLSREKVPLFQCGLCAIVPFYLLFFIELKNMIAVVSLDKQFIFASLLIWTVNQINLLYSQSTFQIYPSIRTLIQTRKMLSLQLKFYASI